MQGIPIPDDISPERLEAVPRELFERLQRLTDHCRSAEQTLQEAVSAEGTLRESRWAWRDHADSLRYVLEGGPEPDLRRPDLADPERYDVLVEQLQSVRKTIAELATSAARVALYWQGSGAHGEDGERLRAWSEAAIRQAQDVLRTLQAEARARVAGKTRRGSYSAWVVRRLSE